MEFLIRISRTYANDSIGNIVKYCSILIGGAYNYYAHMVGSLTELQIQIKFKSRSFEGLWVSMPPTLPTENGWALENFQHANGVQFD